MGRGAGLLLAVAGALTPHLSAQNAAQAKVLAGLGVHWSAKIAAAGQNGQQAVTVPLDKPAAVTYDTAGNFYVADENNNLIRKVDTAGILTNYAGTGDQDFYGDGGPATQAALNHPQGVAIDSSGTLYISDTGNQRLRKVTSAGVISTIAGTGAAGFSGDGAAATAAQLDRPISIAADAKSNVFFADSDNNRIREVVQATGSIVTVAGNGVQGFSGDGGSATSAQLDTPEGLAIDANGNLYLSDTRNSRIRKVSNGTITTIAGTGSVTFAGDGSAASGASFASPRGIAVAADGTLYIADANNQRIRKIAPDGTVTTVAGDGLQGQDTSNGSATSVALDTPRGVSVGPLGSFAIADTSDGLVRSVSSNGNIVTVAGIGTEPATVLTLAVPSQTFVYGQGSVTATATTNTAPTSGNFVFYDFGAVIGTAPISNNSATLALGGLLNAGPHSLSASYAGDAENPAAASNVIAVTITPLALTVTLTNAVVTGPAATVSATGVTVQYGQTVTALAGTLSGVLPKDSNTVSLALSTTATATSAPGAYPITGTLSGTAAANYSLPQPAGTLTITKAGTRSTLTASTGNSLLNAPVTLTATVSSVTTGTPTGTVTFLDGNTTLGTAQLSSGTAQLTVTTLAAGGHSITAAYAGDVDYNGSTSGSAAIQVGDSSFTLTAGSGVSSQTVLPGHAATYNFTLTPTGISFPYPITLSATGLPAGATATFNPASITLGSGPASFTMTVQTSAQTALHRRADPGVNWKGTAPVLALVLLPAAAAFRRRARRLRPLLLIALAMVSLGTVLGISGCGSSSGFFGTPVHSYTINVVATASNGQGVTLQRTLPVTLTVQ